MVAEGVGVTVKERAGRGVILARRPIGARGRCVCLAFDGSRSPTCWMRAWEKMNARKPHGQGSEKVLTLVKNFIASSTPSFTPLPESLMPPKGDISMR